MHCFLEKVSYVLKLLGYVRFLTHRSRICFNIVKLTSWHSLHVGVADLSEPVQLQCRGHPAEPCFAFLATCGLQHCGGRRRRSQRPEDSFEIAGYGYRSQVSFCRCNESHNKLVFLSPHAGGRSALDTSQAKAARLGSSDSWLEAHVCSRVPSETIVLSILY